MRQQVNTAVERLFIGPLRDLVDTTFELITRPASVARRFAQEDGHQFSRAATYFVAAFSASIILNKIASAALGVETIDEVPYWTFYAFAVLSIALLAALIAFPLRPAPASLFVKACCLAYGACFFITGLLLAGASLTLSVLYSVGYIPDFRTDLASYASFQQVGKHAYWNCLREESVLFNAFYNGFAGSYETLKKPIDGLSYVQPVLFIAASFLFGGLAYYGANHRRWAAAAAAILSAIGVISVVLVSAVALDRNLYLTTSCAQRAIKSTYEKTGEDKARFMAEMYTRHVKGKQGPNKIFSLTDVEHEKRSVTLRWRVNERATDENGFADFIEQQRKKLLREYCKSDSAGSDQLSGMTEVWVFRYADTDLVETVVKNQDQCRR
jgi:hypothetical protein